MDCPLAYGCFFVPEKIGLVITPNTQARYRVPDPTLKDGFRAIGIAKNETGNLLRAGDVIMVGNEQAIVEDGYKNGVPLGCYLRVMFKTKTEILIEMVEKVLEYARNA